MPISNETVRKSYLGDGVTTQFPIPFPFYLDTDITVLLGTAPQASGYSITGGEDANGNPQTGTVIFASAPSAGVAMQVVLDVPLTQLVQLVDGTAFPSATLNQVNDRAIQAALRLNDLLARTISAPDGDVSPGLELPAASTRANTYLTFDSNGNLSVAQSVPSGTLSQASIGFFLQPQTASESAAGITPSNYAYAPGHAFRYGTKGDGTTDDTAALVRMFQSGAQALYVPPGTYSVTTVDVTIGANTNLVAYGAKLLNSTQVFSSGAPILRVRGQDTYDCYIYGLEVAGPRLSSSTNVGTGTYAGTGYPSGIDFFHCYRASAIFCKASGTYFAGIEAHYSNQITVSNCDISNHGYAGILISDTVKVIVIQNIIDDVGSTFPNDGYGISSATSYNSPSPGQNTYVYITGNHITRCKRKGIDGHSGLNLQILANDLIGFGYGAIYAVCEGADKVVGDVTVASNRILPDTSFSPTVVDSAITIGQFTGTLSADCVFDVHDNMIFGLVSPSAIFVSNGDSLAHSIKSVKLHHNQFIGGTYSQSAIQFNNNATKYEMVDVHDNTFSNVTCTAAIINARQYSLARLQRNDATGTAVGGVVTYDSLVDLYIGDNSFNGASDVIFASLAYDPPALAIGASASIGLTAQGALIGDFVQVSYSQDLQGITLTGDVFSPNFVRVVFANNTATAGLNLAAGTVYVRVQRRYT